MGMDYFFLIHRLRYCHPQSFFYHLDPRVGSGNVLLAHILDQYEAIHSRSLVIFRPLPHISAPNKRVSYEGLHLLQRIKVFAKKKLNTKLQMKLIEWKILHYSNCKMATVYLTAVSFTEAGRKLFRDRSFLMILVALINKRVPSNYSFGKGFRKVLQRLFFYQTTLAWLCSWNCVNAQFCVYRSQWILLLLSVVMNTSFMLP